jgi:hypothetical protein
LDLSKFRIYPFLIVAFYFPREAFYYLVDEMGGVKSISAKTSVDPILADPDVAYNTLKNAFF